jgi:hypothetical protein
VTGAYKQASNARTATTQSSPARPALSATELAALGHQLDRLSRRVKWLGRHMEPAGDPILWSRWSRAVSEYVELREEIAKLPVTDLAGLALRYRALLWELIEDDLILDHTVRRRAIAFGRELEALAKRASE